MEMDEVIRRMQRLFAAVGALEEFDLTKFTMRVIKSKQSLSISFDGSDASNRPDLVNSVLSAIDNLAKIHDHAKRWARNTGRDPAAPTRVFDASFSLRVIYDLHNNDKHGYPPRDGGTSKRSPRLSTITQGVQAKTQARKGSWSGFTLGLNGLTPIGDGRVSLVLDASIVDAVGNQIGTLQPLLEDGIKAWEAYFESIGVRLEDA